MTKKVAKKREKTPGKKRGPQPLPPDVRLAEIVQTRTTTPERARWERGAELEGVTVAAKIRELMNRWARRVLGPEVRSSESPVPSSGSPADSKSSRRRPSKSKSVPPHPRGRK